MPSENPLGHAHRDESYGRISTEVNIWLPVVDLEPVNALWTESERGLEDFHPLDLEYGEFARFWETSAFILPRRTHRIDALIPVSGCTRVCTGILIITLSVEASQPPRQKRNGAKKSQTRNEKVFFF